MSTSRRFTGTKAPADPEVGVSSRDEELPGESTVVDPKIVTGVGPPGGWEEKTNDQGRPPMPKLGPPTDEQLVTPIPTPPPVPVLAALPLPSSVGRLVVVEGTDRGREFSLGTRQTRVGRGADNHIVLTDISVSRHHVIVHLEGTRYIVEDLGSGNGTLINDVPVEGKTALRSGDQVELGTTILRFLQSESARQRTTVPPPPAAPDARPRTQSGLALPLTPFPLNAAPSQESAEFPAAAYPFAEVGARDEAPVVDVVLPAHTAGSRRWWLLGAGAFALVVTLAAVAARGTRRPRPLVTAAPQTITIPIFTPVLMPFTAEPDLRLPDPAVAAVAQADLTRPPEIAPPPRAKVVRATKRPVVRTAAVKPPKTPAPRKPASPAQKPQLASRQAAALYGQQRFEDAARAALSGSIADPALRAVARDYASVGANLTKGDRAAADAPTTAMTAYQEALRADQRSGRGHHAKLLRARMTRVAPRAAVGFVEAGRFEQARAAADLAPNDALSRRVRQDLERHARDLFNRGQDLARREPDTAKQLWRRVMKMVPDESPWYEKADAALSKAGISDVVDL